MEQARNRVFINPNFNKTSNNSGPIKQTPVMHVNPNFYQHAQITPGTGAKIFINPNFVKPNIIRHQTRYLNAHFRPMPVKDIKSSTARVSAVKTHEGDSCTKLAPTKPAAAYPFQANSRYSLVRHNASEPLEPKMTNTKTHTVKISKYKSIKITDMKKNLESIKLPGKAIPIITDSHKSITQTKTISVKNINPHTLIACGKKYTLVRPSTAVNKPQFKKQTSINSKKATYNNRFKTVGVYKKNNIPCPQFRKYGKCLRNIQGKCIFFHDKKHVSICRKFLTGACHDNKCLLSHELSHKKMPTCYFYLKGMCTKEGCPYLHVKLNEKAKICSDFVRGYCDKGEKCLNKHISRSLAIDAKPRHSPTGTGTHQNRKQEKPQKSMKYKLEKSKVKINVKSTQKRNSKIHIHEEPYIEKNNESGERYYKGSIQDNNCIENIEVIKPSRCKLGALPSFIQL